jgi:hypothetical protein
VKYDRSKISPSIVAEMTCTKEFFSLQCRSKKNIRFRGDSLVPNLPESDSPELTRLLRRAAVIQLVAEDSLSKLLDRILTTSPESETRNSENKNQPVRTGKWKISDPRPWT